MSFDPSLWAKQHAVEALEIGPAPTNEQRRETGAKKYSEALNTRFLVNEQYIDRGFSVTENRLEVVDRVAGQTVAKSRTFSLPLGNGKQLISFDLNIPKSCYTDRKYWAMLEALRAMGRAR